jgi:hypothetical protein
LHGAATARGIMTTFGAVDTTAETCFFELEASVASVAHFTAVGDSSVWFRIG